jgi:hypothetical protein
MFSVVILSAASLSNLYILFFQPQHPQKDGSGNIFCLRRSTGVSLRWDYFGEV